MNNTLHVEIGLIFGCNDSCHTCFEMTPSRPIHEWSGEEQANMLAVRSTMTREDHHTFPLGS